MQYCTFKSQQTIKDLLEKGLDAVGENVRITGHLSRFKHQKNMIFGELTDGSCSSGLQFVYQINEQLSLGIQDLIDRAQTGASITLSGNIVTAPPKATQDIELSLTDAKVISVIRNADTYAYGTSSMKKRTHTQWDEYLRSIRSDTYGRFKQQNMSAIMRIRGKCQAILIKFFDTLNFVKTDSPLLTRSDCEGAGEMFTVTTLPLENVPKTPDGRVDYSKDFFGEEAHLTVSGQLEAEALARVLGRVFTFGPTFRAENSHTSRHLAEFWMLEPELVFDDIDLEKRFSSLLDLEESMVKYAVSELLQKCMDDFKLLDSTCSPGIIEKLEKTLSTSFERITYTECITILEKAISNGKQFEDVNVFWGMDLASEHERFLCEEVYDKPIFVTHYPQDLKSFYMKADNDCPSDRKTCQAVDLLVPGVGELCGGSMREDDAEKLLSVMSDKKIPVKDLQWYVDLRNDGGLSTGGFGMGFTRFISYVTGVNSVRDTIPFPRYPGKI